jgi:triacylglycerol lipase
MFAVVTGFLALWAVAHAAPSAKTAPTVAVRNGTYTGVHSTTYGQDFFLGMPYAQQPVGNLRFTVPQSMNESWNEARDAKEYSDICVGYGVKKGFLSLQILILTLQ